MNADLIISNIGQLVTCASGGEPKRGVEMLDVGIIDNGALAVVGGKFAGVGTTAEIQSAFTSDNLVDAAGKVVMPGFVDPHTHIVYTGDRLNEFELKIKGADYLEILTGGGGIISTVKSTRAASIDQLTASTLERLDKMVACGTTTCEIKTGYGLDLETELKMLEVIAEVDRRHSMTIVPTFLAAHTIPPEFKNNTGGYVDSICDTMLQQAWTWFVGSAFYGKTPFFCDVFCESGAFSLEDSQKILETARSLGFKLKAHVDQFNNLGASRLAIESDAVSIDHLDMISDEEIALLAASDTIGVVIPTENFSGGKTVFANARKLIDSNCAIALSTDYNPGSAPCPSQPMAMAIACRYQKLLPSEALNAATVNAAYAIGLGGTCGSIEVGKQADMLVVDGNDYRVVSYEFGGNLVGSAFKAGKNIR